LNTCATAHGPRTLFQLPGKPGNACYSTSSQNECTLDCEPHSWLPCNRMEHLHGTQEQQSELSRMSFRRSAPIRSKTLYDYGGPLANSSSTPERDNDFRYTYRSDSLRLLRKTSKYLHNADSFKNTPSVLSAGAPHSHERQLPLSRPWVSGQMTMAPSRHRSQRLPAPWRHAAGRDWASL